MTARTARLEVVRGDDGWFWRYVAGNGKELARSSETYKRRAACAHSWSLIATGAIHGTYAWLDLDERTPPLPPAAAEPPYYVKTTYPILDIGTRRARLGPAEDYWHDRDYHWRNCDDDDCTKGTPPVGAAVHVRGDVVKSTAAMAKAAAADERTTP